jgi:hypothetical protein
VFLSLISLSCGPLFWIFSILPVPAAHPQLSFNLRFASMCCFGISASFAVVGLQHVARDTREKVEAVIRKVGIEIEGLQEKLRVKRGDDSA